jgi:hypothetical protein
MKFMQTELISKNYCVQIRTLNTVFKLQAVSAYWIPEKFILIIWSVTSARNLIELQNTPITLGRILKKHPWRFHCSACDFVNSTRSGEGKQCCDAFCPHSCKAAWSWFCCIMLHYVDTSTGELIACPCICCYSSLSGYGYVEAFTWCKTALLVKASHTIEYFWGVPLTVKSDNMRQ